MRDENKELIGRDLSFHGYQIIVPIMDPDEDPWDWTEECSTATCHQARLNFYDRKVYLPLAKINFGDIVRLARAIILCREVCPG